jgi:hypothetical protein
MPVIIGLFIGRWSRVVNDKTENGGQRPKDRGQMSENG